jgi:hypothetical protein
MEEEHAKEAEAGMSIRLDRKHLIAVWLLWCTVWLVGCGPTPYPTPTPSLTPRPTTTLYPTFTPTAPHRAAVSSATPEPASESPTPGSARETSVPTPSEEPSATLPPDTPTPAATRAVGPPPRLTGQILFPVFDVNRQTYDLYRLDLSTGQLGLLQAEASQPALSPDGTQVAYRSWRPDFRGLVVRSVEEGDAWRLTEFTEAARPRWSPESERFLFFGRQEPDRKERIYLFTGAASMPVVEVRRDGSPILGTAPAWLPDGRMVYQGCYRDKCGLIQIHVDGTGSTVLVEDTTAVAPDVSPDGSQAAFMSQLGGYWQVNVVNADGSGWRRLTDDWYWNGLPVWSPDGRYIAFVSTRDENWPDTFVKAENRTFSLWVMDADGGSQRQLNPFTWVLDGVPGSVPRHEHGGWVEEGIAWGP